MGHVAHTGYHMSGLFSEKAEPLLSSQEVAPTGVYEAPIQPTSIQIVGLHLTNLTAPETGLST